ncbi:MAG: hypothetical protein KDA44_02590 [Planctomycetales bacterium]|nr:hypothetical protein [Planctomycetales bacterium]
MTTDRLSPAENPSRRTTRPLWRRLALLTVGAFCAVVAAFFIVVWWIVPYCAAAPGTESSTADLVVPPQEKYKVAPGLYRQAHAQGGERFLSIDGAGRGRLIVEPPAAGAFVIGADRVEIDTTWEVEGDDVTFYLQGGRPDASYKRLLVLALDETTRFHIRSWAPAALTLERVDDGELFQWERIDDSPLPAAEPAVETAP